MTSDKCSLRQLIDWWNETDNSQGELQYELEYNNINLSVDQFLVLASIKLSVDQFLVLAERGK